MQLLAFDWQQVHSSVYFATAGILIFIAAVLAGRKVHRRLKVQWIAGIAGFALVALALIWLLLAVFNRKEATPAAAPPDYPATGTP